MLLKACMLLCVRRRLTIMLMCSYIRIVRFTAHTQKKKQMLRKTADGETTMYPA